MPRGEVVLNGVVGSERCDELGPGDVEIVSCLNERAKSVLSSLFTLFVDDCRRSDSDAPEGDAMAQ